MNQIVQINWQEWIDLKKALEAYLLSRKLPLCITKKAPNAAMRGQLFWYL
jgi:hypothetical protein